METIPNTSLSANLFGEGGIPVTHNIELSDDTKRTIFIVALMLVATLLIVKFVKI